MSKISITPNPSGTGVFTISSPATNTDRSLTLPDEAGTVLTSASTANFPAGSVLQVVNSVTVTRDITASASWVATGITASITPISTSSKIFIIVSTSGNVNNTSSHNLYYSLFRNSTNLGHANYGMGEIRGITVNIRAPINPSYLDSPSTTSSVSYTLHFYSNGGSTVEIPGNAGQTRSITLMEIAG